MHAFSVRGLYAIVDLPHAAGLDPVAVAEALLEGGAGALQLRAKASSMAQRRAWAEALAKVCRELDRPFIINDDVELALAGIPGVSGLHLGQEDLVALDPEGVRAKIARAGLQLGISTHDLEQVDAASEHAPSYLGFGPVFGTQTKARPDPTTGPDALARACARTSLPVVAIGGIDATNAGACLHAGAAAVAVIGALVRPDLERIRACAAEFCSVARASPR